GHMISTKNVLRQIDRPATAIPAAAAASSSGAPTKPLFRRFLIAGLYLLAGLALIGVAVRTVVGHVMHMNVETAVTSLPLEQVVSTDLGLLAELYVKAGVEVKAGQPLLRIDSELAERTVQAARKELQAAQITLRESQSRR